MAKDKIKPNADVIKADIDKVPFDVHPRFEKCHISEYKDLYGFFAECHKNRQAGMVNDMFLATTSPFDVNLLRREYLKTTVWLANFGQVKGCHQEEDKKLSKEEKQLKADHQQELRRQAKNAAHMYLNTNKFTEKFYQWIATQHISQQPAQHQQA
ncbi:hypothetical protein CPC16_011802 [Podila verticillata]|nr:hypothetical protein CPC16_011802 [Podila verticillata]